MYCNCCPCLSWNCRKSSLILPRTFFSPLWAPSGIGITTVCGGDLESFGDCGLLSDSPIDLSACAADFSGCAEIEFGSFADLPVFCSLGFCRGLVCALPSLVLACFVLVGVPFA